MQYWRSIEDRNRALLEFAVLHARNIN